MDTSTGLGNPLVAAIVAVAIVIAIVVIVRRRRRPSPPPSAAPPPEPTYLDSSHIIEGPLVRNGERKDGADTPPKR